MTFIVSFCAVLSVRAVLEIYVGRRRRVVMNAKCLWDKRRGSTPPTASQIARNLLWFAFVLFFLLTEHSSRVKCNYSLSFDPLECVSQQQSNMSWPCLCQPASWTKLKALLPPIANLPPYNWPIDTPKKALPCTSNEERAEPITARKQLSIWCTINKRTFLWISRAIIDAIDANLIRASKMWKVKMKTQQEYDDRIWKVNWPRRTLAIHWYIAYDEEASFDTLSLLVFLVRSKIGFWHVMHHTHTLEMLECFARVQFRNRHWGQLESRDAHGPFHSTEIKYMKCISHGARRTTCKFNGRAICHGLFGRMKIYGRF